MRREAFDTPGALELTVRVPSGDIHLDTVEGTESVVEISASPSSRRTPGSSSIRSTTATS